MKIRSLLPRCGLLVLGLLQCVAPLAAHAESDLWALPFQWDEIPTRTIAGKITALSAALGPIGFVCILGGGGSLNGPAVAAGVALMALGLTGQYVTPAIDAAIRGIRRLATGRTHAGADAGNRTPRHGETVPSGNALGAENAAAGILR